KDMHIEINGKEIKNLNQHLIIGDEILVIPKIEHPILFIIAAAKWFMALSVLAKIGVILTTVSMGYSVYQAIAVQRVKTPSFDTSGDGLDADSPSSSWDGVRTTANVGTPIPVICGTVLTGGNVLNEYVSTDGDKNYLHTLLGICHGEVDSITLIRINRNPAANYSGYTLESRLGTNTQTVISDFHDNHNLKSIAIQITKDDAYTYTTEDDDVEAFEVHFQLPSGLYQTDANGNILSNDVTYKIEYKLHSSETWIDLGSTTISAKSRSSLKRIFRQSGLTTGQYDIRVTKTSDDSDFTHTSDLYIERIDEISCEDEQEFPNIAVAGVKSLAMDQLSGSFPDYEFLARGKFMIPKVMNGENIVSWDDYYWDPTATCYKLLSDGIILTWDGVTFITAYSANPIWFLYHLMINKRFGLGHFITSSDHNLDYLVEMSQYCEERVPDGLGGWEKRFRLDICIDSPQKALDLILQLCSVFRGLPFYSDRGQIKIAIEKPEIPVQLIHMGNIVKDSFSETWDSIRDVPNIVNVQFNDQDNNYETSTIQAAIDDEALAAGKPVNIKTIRYYGTKLSYAIRYGRDYLKICKYISNTIKLSAGIGALVRQCGELIDIAHDVPQWGFSGLVKADFDYKGTYDADTLYAINDAVAYEENEYKAIQPALGNLPTDTDYWQIISRTKVKLDRNVIIESGKSYAIRVDFAKGAYEERIITDPTGTYTEVTVSSPFSKIPMEHDGYSFGEVDKVVKPARIVSLKRKRNCELEIEAVEYDERIYDDSTVILPQRKYSSLSMDIPDVTGLKLTERMIVANDGTIEDAIDVWFDKPNMTNYSVNNFTKAKIYLSDNAGLSWSFAGETTGIHFAITGNLKDLQAYRIAVVSVGVTGEKSILTSPQENITLVGKSAPPQDVANFIVNQSRDRIVFSWSHVTDVDRAGYEIRMGESWESGYPILNEDKKNTAELPIFKTGENQKFYIKAKDTSGNYSQNATEAIITIDNIPFQNIIKSYSEQSVWSGTLENLEVVDGVLKITEGNLTGKYITPVRDVGYVAPFKIGIDSIVTATGDTKWSDFAETLKWSDLPDNLRFSGEELAGAASFRIKTSEDNINWSDWLLWQPGDYNCRFFQVEMTLIRNSTAQDLQCSQMNYFADLPDVDDKFEDEITDAAAGKDVVFNKTFHEIPYGVDVIPLTGNGVYRKITNLDTTGGNIKLYDLVGAPATGQIKVHVHGI
ncbi:MAG: hypothetical protein ABSB18_06445, partial [Candidatus Omnitrophota bacterium]